MNFDQQNINTARSNLNNLFEALPRESAVIKCNGRVIARGTANDVETLSTKIADALKQSDNQTIEIQVGNYKVKAYELNGKQETGTLMMPRHANFTSNMYAGMAGGQSVYFQDSFMSSTKTNAQDFIKGLRDNPEGYQLDYDKDQGYFLDGKLFANGFLGTHDKKEALQNMMKFYEENNLTSTRAYTNASEELAQIEGGKVEVPTNDHLQLMAKYDRMRGTLQTGDFRQYALGNMSDSPTTVTVKAVGHNGMSYGDVINDLARQMGVDTEAKEYDSGKFMSWLQDNHSDLFMSNGRGLKAGNSTQFTPAAEWEGMPGELSPKMTLDEYVDAVTQFKQDLKDIAMDEGLHLKGSEMRAFRNKGFNIDGLLNHVLTECQDSLQFQNDIAGTFLRDTSIAQSSYYKLNALENSMLQCGVRISKPEQSFDDFTGAMWDSIKKPFVASEADAPIKSEFFSEIPANESPTDQFGIVAKQNGSTRFQVMAESELIQSEISCMDSETTRNIVENIWAAQDVKGYEDLRADVKQEDIGIKNFFYMSPSGDTQKVILIGGESSSSRGAFHFIDPNTGQDYYGESMDDICEQFSKNNSLEDAGRLAYLDSQNNLQVTKVPYPTIKRVRDIGISVATAVGTAAMFVPGGQVATVVTLSAFGTGAVLGSTDLIEKFAEGRDDITAGEVVGTAMQFVMIANGFTKVAMFSGKTATAFQKGSKAYNELSKATRFLMKATTFVDKADTVYDGYEVVMSIAERDAGRAMMVMQNLLLLAASTKAQQLYSSKGSSAQYNNLSKQYESMASSDPQFQRKPNESAMDHVNRVAKDLDVKTSELIESAEIKVTESDQRVSSDHEGFTGKNLNTEYKNYSETEILTDPKLKSEVDGLVSEGYAVPIKDGVIVSKGSEGTHWHTMKVDHQKINQFNGKNVTDPNQIADIVDMIGLSRNDLASTYKGDGQGKCDILLQTTDGNVIKVEVDYKLNNEGMYIVEGMNLYIPNNWDIYNQTATQENSRAINQEQLKAYVFEDCALMKEKSGTFLSEQNAVKDIYHSYENDVFALRNEYKDKINTARNTQHSSSLVKQLQTEFTFKYQALTKNAQIKIDDINMQYVARNSRLQAQVQNEVALRTVYEQFNHRLDDINRKTDATIIKATDPKATNTDLVMAYNDAKSMTDGLHRFIMDPKNVISDNQRERMMNIYDNIRRTRDAVESRLDSRGIEPYTGKKDNFDIKTRTDATIIKATNPKATNTDLVMAYNDTKGIINSLHQYLNNPNTRISEAKRGELMEIYDNMVRTEGVLVSRLESNGIDPETQTIK